MLESLFNKIASPIIKLLIKLQNNVVCTSPDIKVVLSTEKTCVVLHSLANILLRMLNYLTKKRKEKLSNAACAFYTIHRDKFMSPKQKLLTFLVEVNTARGKGLLGSRRHNFKHLQHSCSSRPAVLLTFLEDNAQNYLSYFSSHIPEIHTIDLFLPF